MFVVWVGAVLTTLLGLQAAFGQGEAPTGFIFAITAWLWFTVLFANFAEATAEGRGQGAGRRAAADAPRRPREAARGARRATPAKEIVPAATLRKGDCRARRGGRRAALRRDGHRGRRLGRRERDHGESAPVIRESGGDRSAVTGGTRVLSDWLVVRCTADPGETFLDRMIALVEGAKRKKTPNEIALDILLAAPLDRVPARDGDAPAVLEVRRRRRGTGHGRRDHGARGAPRVPHPDDDRRPPLGDRHRRHGPHGPQERDRDLGPRRRGGRRRRRPAARQDGHDHAREPPGRRVPPRPRRRRGDARGRGPVRLARRRDARGSQHRRAREAAVRLPRATAPGDRRDVRPVHRAVAHERSRRRGALRSARARPTRSERLVESNGRRAARRRLGGRRARRAGRGDAAPRRGRRHSSSASSSCATSSRAGSRSGSARSAGWASRP